MARDEPRPGLLNRPWLFLLCRCQHPCGESKRDQGADRAGHVRGRPCPDVFGKVQPALPHLFAGLYALNLVSTSGVGFLFLFAPRAL